MKNEFFESLKTSLNQAIAFERGDTSLATSSLSKSDDKDTIDIPYSTPFPEKSALHSIFLCLFMVLCLFGCNVSEEHDYEQIVINNSDYDVYMNNTLVESGTTAKINLAMGIEDDDEYLSMTSSDYPRVAVTRKCLSLHTYQYTIANTQPCKVSITNALYTDIKVKNPYFCKTYNADYFIAVEAGKTKESDSTDETSFNLYNNYTTFSAYSSDTNIALSVSYEPIYAETDKTIIGYSIIVR